VAIVGGGVSGLTCAVLFAERGYRTTIFAKETGQQTTSGAAGALWFPYDAEPADKVIGWALETYNVLLDLAQDSHTGVSVIELRQLSRTADLAAPHWASSLGARRLQRDEIPPVFASGFALHVPFMDTTIYLDDLAERFLKAGGKINANVRFDKLQDVGREFDLVINCAGIGARALVQDADLEPHRGQVAIVPKIDNLLCAIVCDDPPLMYAIPRTNDCVFGGTNEVCDDLAVDPDSTARILDECSRVLKIDNPQVIAERVGLRPFRKSGVRLERDQLPDGRMVIHDYGHGGSGFTLSWGCAQRVLNLAAL
jgi:D-amino-acid oxidase